MIGRTNAGGGGGGLNFKVVGGTSAPSSPKENTLWVNTETEISGWVFSAEEPGEPAEGMVWFATGATSTVEFNALKKNGIQVYPISAKQYVGAWVDKTAKSYQGGVWVEWTRYLLNRVPVIAWQTRAWRYSSVSFLAGMPTAIQANEGVRLSVPDNTTGVYETVEDIDLTDISKIYLEVSNENNIEVTLSVGNRNGTYALESAIANTKIKGTDGTFVLDVGAIGGIQCVYLALPRPQTIIVKRIWVE